MLQILNKITDRTKAKSDSLSFVSRWEIRPQLVSHQRRTEKLDELLPAQASVRFAATRWGKEIEVWILVKENREKVSFITNKLKSG